MILETTCCSWADMKRYFFIAGDPANDTKHRIDCPGMGNETCPVTYEYVVICSKDLTKRCSCRSWIMLTRFVCT